MSHPSAVIYFGNPLPIMANARRARAYNSPFPEATRECSRHSFPALLFAALLGTAFGQSTKPQKPASTPETHVDVPAVAARPEDVSTLDGILKAFYDVISGPAGQPRQWSRDRSLYMPEIRFVAMSINKKGRPVAHIVNHQQFVDTSNDYFLKEGSLRTGDSPRHAALR